MIEWIWIVFLLILFVGYNAYVTWLLRKADFSTKEQKKAQTIFVWVVPILGAILVHYVCRSVVWDGKPDAPAEGSECSPLNSLRILDDYIAYPR